MKSTQIITRTAILIALACVFQSLRLITPNLPYQQYVIGLLVNLVLFVAADLVSAYAGIAVAFITPIVAFMQGGIPLIIMVPFVIIGNVLLVSAFAYLKKHNVILSVILSAIIKWGFLTLTITKLLPRFTNINEKVLAAFSLPQLVTALIGGFISIFVIRMLSPVLKKDNDK